MKIFPTVITCALLSSGILLAADWPTHLHDNYRSGITSEQLNALNLSEDWRFTAQARPQPAWRGKMVRDSWARRTFQIDPYDYDKAFNLIAADGQVFFSSSSGAACVALDADTGAENWRFPVGGAVRVAPAYDGGNVYFSSDDGQAYSVDATDGSLNWSYRGGPSDINITNDHKFLTRYPSRTGVLVQGGKAYCGFGLLTWHENYMVKLNANTGAEENKTTKSYIEPDTETDTNLSFEGVLLADATTLYATQGRNPPASFALSNAAYIGAFTGIGGTFATLTTSGTLFNGSGHDWKRRHDHMMEQNASTRAQISRINYTSRIVINGTDRYSLVRDAVYATGSSNWNKAVEKPKCIIIGGTDVYVGSHNLITVYDSATGNIRKTLAVKGDVYCLAIADGALFASTHSGQIYCFR